MMPGTVTDALPQLPPPLRAVPLMPVPPVLFAEVNPFALRPGPLRAKFTVAVTLQLTSGVAEAGPAVDATATRVDTGISATSPIRILRCIDNALSLVFLGGTVADCQPRAAPPPFGFRSEYVGTASADTSPKLMIRENTF